MTQTAQVKQHGPPPSFEGEAREVMGRLRDALASLISGAGAEAAGVRRAADVRRLFGCDPSLGWQIFRVATSRQPMSVGVLVPGPAPMRRVLEAARGRGVPEPSIMAATEAYEQFEQLVKRHAGDRASFDAMVGTFADESGEGTDRLAQRHKRAAYRANSYAWGVQSEAFMSLAVVRPNDAGFVEGCFVRGSLRLRQLRPDVPCVFRTASRLKERGELVRGVTREPLEPATYNEHGVALIKSFCSAPLPLIETWAPEPGVAAARMRMSDVGRTSAIDVVIGEAFRADTPRPAAGDVYSTSKTITTPTELLILDLAVPKGLSSRESACARTSGDRFITAPSSPTSETQELPFNESARFLGQGLEALRTPAMPRYADLCRYVFDRLGWDADSFDVYRASVDFPLMFSEVRLTVDAID